MDRVELNNLLKNYENAGASTSPNSSNPNII